MKITLASICLLFFSSAFSQHPIVDKLWIGDVGNYMLLDSLGARVQYTYEYAGKKHLQTNSYKYSMSGDTLHLIEWNSSNDKHDFLIITLPNKDLKFIPITRYAWTLANPKSTKTEFTFRSQEHIYTDTISLEKIVFSSTNCYGSCPAMSLQIDNNKQMKFIGSFYAIKEGPHTANLSEEQYNELLKILAISNLDKLENAGRFNVDSPTYGLEVHYNHKIRYLQTSSIPLIANKLMRYLIDLPTKVELKPAGPMEIHFDTPGGEIDIFKRK
jgi:uncharacterized protein DUF6438